mmetsp:Transcript_10781/g.32362  ORF Transcript_10781/g.32362 Transcript_10781/m.32362 type:complete len:245 (+) Transcript_10781:439-1173(+)
MMGSFLELEVLELRVAHHLRSVHSRQHLVGGFRGQKRLDNELCHILTVDSAAHRVVLREHPLACCRLRLQAAGADDGVLEPRLINEEVLGLALLHEDLLQNVVHLLRGGVLGVSGANAGHQHEPLDTLLHGRFDEVDVALGVRRGISRGASNGGHDRIHFLDLIEGRLHLLRIHGIALDNERHHALNFRRPAVAALQHPHPCTRVLQLSRHVQRNPAAPRHQHACVVGLQLCAQCRYRHSEPTR